MQLISKSHALQIAEAYAKSVGWPVRHPLDAKQIGTLPFNLGPKRWCVISNAESLGSGFRIEIDADTGNILSAAFTPR